MARTEPTPTYFFDPTATSSTGAGTFANPYNSIAQVVAGFTGNMAGQVLGIKRGATIRVPSTGFVINCYGATGNHAQIRAYGDADLRPIITAAVVRRDWVNETSLDSRVWSISNISAIQSIFYAGTRIEMRSSFAAMQAAGRGFGHYDGTNKLFFIPPDNSNPNNGQTEVTGGAAAALRVTYSNVAASGFLTVAGLSIGYSRNCALTIDGPDSGVGSITSIGAIHVCDNTFAGCGTDGANLGCDAMVIYGVSDAVRIASVYVAGNSGSDVINNSIELGAVTAGTVENNTFTKVGGNSILELWYSCSGIACRYNKGTNENAALLSSRLITSYAKAGIWHNIASDMASSVYDHTKNINCSYFGNLIVDAPVQGIRIDGGTGHSVFNNTIVNAGNRGLNFASLAPVTGTVSAAINNNVVTLDAGGNRIAADVMQGTALNAAGVSITSTLTGDKNLYHSTGAINWRVNNTSQGFLLATYKTNVNPFDVNALQSNPTLDSNYRPQTGSPTLNAGATVASWTMDLDGDAIRGAPSIGCYQTRYAAMTQTCASEG